MNYYALCWYFVIYSFVGWCVEVIFQAITKGKVINRGFLNGPVCPIYGFGMLAVLLFFKMIHITNFAEASGLLMFVAGVILTTAIELFGGWILDVLFHTKWWDYSKERFNFHGYICLRFSIFWGIGVVFIMHVIHPIVQKFSVDLIPPKIGWWILLACYSIYLIDLVVTVTGIIGLNQQLHKLKDAQASLRIVSDKISTQLGEGALKTTRKLEEKQIQGELAKQHIKGDLEQLKSEYENRVKAIKENIACRKHSVVRLMKAFPNMDMHEYQDNLQELKQLIRDKMKEKD